MYETDRVVEIRNFKLNHFERNEKWMVSLNNFKSYFVPVVAYIWKSYIIPASIILSNILIQATVQQ